MEFKNGISRIFFVRIFPVCVILSGVFGYSYAAEEHRIVTLVPSATKMVADLGRAASLVGITKYCERPENATRAQIVGSLQTPNLELIVSLRPTLVIADIESNRPATVDKLRAVNIPVLVLDNSRTVGDLMVAFKRVAEKIGAERDAENFLQKFQKDLKKITNRIKGQERKRVFIEIWSKPLITASGDSFIHNIVETAGGKNVFADSPIAYSKISMESVIARRPEVILVLTNMDSEAARTNAYREFAPLRSCKVAQIDDPDLTTPCLSSFLHSVEIVAEVLHPEMKNKEGGQ